MIKAPFIAVLLALTNTPVLQTLWFVISARGDTFSSSTPRLDTEVAHVDTYLGSPLHPQWWCSPLGFQWGWRTCTWERQTAGEHDEPRDWAKPGLPPKTEVLSHPSCVGGEARSGVYGKAWGINRPGFYPWLSHSHYVTHIPCCLPVHNGAGKTLIIFMT